VALVSIFGLESQLSGKRVAVVRETTRLNSQPVLGSERGPSAVIGEVVRLRGARGAWTLVRLDDGREGWIDGSDLISLDLHQTPAN
jgi:hypothetical protein